MNNPLDYALMCTIVNRLRDTGLAPRWASLDAIRLAQAASARGLL